eukprot:Skav229715  [mRNA]  locus=scaffold49:212240:214102:- [translate_table: standard]
MGIVINPILRESMNRWAMTPPWVVAALWELPAAEGPWLLGHVWPLRSDRRSTEPFRELCLYDHGDINSFCEMTLLNRSTNLVSRENQTP